MESARNLRSFLRTTLKTSCVGNILTRHTSFFGRALTAEANELSAHIIVARCSKKLNDYCNCVAKCCARQGPRNRQVFYEIWSFEPPWEPAYFYLLVEDCRGVTACSCLHSQPWPKNMSIRNWRAKCAKCASGWKNISEVSWYGFACESHSHSFNEVKCRTVSFCNSLRVPMRANESSAL